jgi:hypothetical protein
MNKEKFSPPIVFAAYMAASFIAICAFRYFFPGNDERLIGYFDFKWRLFNGIINFIGLYPCLAFSALVIPFGLKEHTEGGYAGSTFVGNKGFSPQFLQYITLPVITASAAAALYGLLFFLALPLASNARSAILERGELYQTAKARAVACSADREWAEANQFIEICETIWPKSEEIEKLKSDINSALTKYHLSLLDEKTPQDEAGELPPVAGNPVDSIEAMGLAEAAFNEGRYYDAHWLATLAGRLARRGSAEIPTAAALAARAWDMISSREPNAEEKERFSLFRMKRGAYEAMLEGDWITAFYTFQELLDLTPNDPDVENYFEASKKGLANVAFFIDELDLALGTVQKAVIFSLPVYNPLSAGLPETPAESRRDEGRLVLRFDSLTTLSNYSYAWVPEIAAVNGQEQLMYRVSADYGKIVPISVRDSEGQDIERTALLLRALDRTSKDKRWDPVWTEGAGGRNVGNAQILLNCSYDDFLLLSRLKRGAGALQLGELLSAEQRAGDYGYAPEIFKAEFLNRLSEPVFFLPAAMLVLLLGWRYRARRQPRYVYVPMLGILPLVFNGVTAFYRSILNDLSIWLSLSFGFTAAIVYFTIGAAVCFIAALVLLASQHG